MKKLRECNEFIVEGEDFQPLVDLVGLKASCKK